MEQHENNHPIEVRFFGFRPETLVALASVGVILICFIVLGFVMRQAAKVTDDANSGVYTNDSLLLQNQQTNDEHEDNEINAYLPSNVIRVYFNDLNSLLFDNAMPVLADGEEFDPANIKEINYRIHNKEEALAVCEQIRLLDNIGSVTYVSKEEALAEWLASDTPKADYFNSFLNEQGVNPISDGAVIVLVSVDDFEDTLNKIKSIQGIHAVEYFNGVFDSYDYTGGLVE